MLHPTLRRCVFWSHLVLGILAGLVILVMAVTGLLMSFETQIINRVESSMVRAKSNGDTTPLTPSEMVAAYQKAGITGRPTTIAYQSDPDAPVTLAAGRGNQQLFHPTTGESLGKGAVATRRFFQISLSLHRWLTWPANRAGQGGGGGGAPGGNNRAGEAGAAANGPAGAASAAGTQAGPAGPGGGEARGSSWRDIGGQITSAGALVFLFLLVSGLVIWLPKKRVWKAFKVVLTFQPRLKGRARDWNWHNVAGIWASPFILTICLTGIIMAYPWANRLLFRAFGDTPPIRQEQAGGGGREGAGSGGARREGGGLEGAGRREGGGPAGERSEGGGRRERGGREGGRGEGRGEGAIAAGGGGRERGGRPGGGGNDLPLVTTGLDALAAYAKREVPDWRSMSLEIPGTAEQPLVVTVSDAGRGRPDRRQKITLAADTMEVVKRETFADLKPAAKARQVVRWLHTGEFGGWIGQLLAALTCAATAVLIWTGFALSFRRFFLRRKKTVQPTP